MPVLVLLLVAMAAELAVIIAVGQAVGVLTTILLLIGVSVLGVSLLRRQGVRTLMALADAGRTRRDARPEVTDGLLIAVAAGFILFPGFLSDLVGLFLLFPPTRGIVRRRLLKRATRGPRVHGDVVDGEVVNDPPVNAPDVIVIESRRED
jgi:UPF0716 protein FxsA